MSKQETPGLPPFEENTKVGERGMKLTSEEIRKYLNEGETKYMGASIKFMWDRILDLEAKLKHNTECFTLLSESYRNAINKHCERPEDVLCEILKEFVRRLDG